MKTYINPNKIIKADIREPAEQRTLPYVTTEYAGQYQTVPSLFEPAHGWQLIVILEDNDDVVIECSSEEECIAWCNSFNLIQVK